MATQQPHEAEAPDVSVVMPAQNERDDIGRALAAVLAQDLDLGRVEIIVADGGSTDGTVEHVRAVLGDSPSSRWQVLHNDGGTTPSNLNAALGAVTGRIVCRVDARSIVPPHYVRRCAELLDEDPVRRVVGGAQVALARNRSVTAAGIARALNNRWGMGLARYRRGAGSGPTDTVYLGAFRADELRDAGGWDERFPTNQDFELNRRMGRDGVVWFEDSLRVGYLPRAGLVDLFRQYRRFGEWKVRYWRTTDDPPQPRQILLLLVAPLASVVVLALLAAPLRLRLLAAAAAAAATAIVERRGADDPCAGVLGHLVAVVALAAVASGWSVGAWSELLLRRAERRALASPRLAAGR